MCYTTDALWNCVSGDAGFGQYEESGVPEVN